MSNLNFVGVVLAGGRSARMGCDKSQLKYQNTTMEHAAVQLLKDCGAKQVILNKNNFSSGTVPDIYPDRGPLSGIHTAIYATNKPLLIIPVDMPLLNKGIVLNLVANGELMRTCVHYAEHYLPLYIPNKSAIRLYLEEILQRPRANTTISRFLTEIGHAQITVSDPSLFADINSPDQWHKINQMIPQKR